jgi:hypothetical protein
MAQAFTCAEAVDKWMETPSRELRGLAPLEMLQIDPERVVNYALRASGGVP